jgi:hypothetical protein
MYCFGCGSRNPESGKFCHECGIPLVRTNPELQRRTPSEKELLLEVLQIDPKLTECSRCGAESDLKLHRFAIAKVVSVKREWGETIAHASMSAVSIVAAPVTGVGLLSWKSPKKTTQFTLVKAELILCLQCMSRAWKDRSGGRLTDDAYRCHPWAEAARRVGYDKYLSAEEVARMQPIALAELEIRRANLQRTGWYPNTRQWWAIWITAILVVLGLMAGGEGMMFAVCVALIGALLVWRLSDQSSPH